MSNNTEEINYLKLPKIEISKKLAETILFDVANFIQLVDTVQRNDYRIEYWYDKGDDIKLLKLIQSSGTNYYIIDINA